MGGVAPLRVGIVGAGMAGLTCASHLQRCGFAVSVLDKGRGLGGRLSTRRLETPRGTVQADLGAPVFEVRDPAFAAAVAGWEKEGLTAPWAIAGADKWVATPAMNAILKHQAASIDVSFGRMVKALQREREAWLMLAEEEWLGPFDVVVLAVPAEQAVPLLSLHDFDQARVAVSVTMAPCWTGVFVFDQPLPIASSYWEGKGVIERAIRNTAKPGREGPETWVVQANMDWSADHLEEQAGVIGDRLLTSLSDMFDRPLPPPICRSLHRWRYARTVKSGQLNLWNESLRIGACGDWLIGSTLEAAWLSGIAAATRIVENLGIRARC